MGPAWNQVALDVVRLLREKKHEDEQSLKGVTPAQFLKFVDPAVLGSVDHEDKKLLRLVGSYIKSKYSEETYERITTTLEKKLEGEAASKPLKLTSGAQDTDATAAEAPADPTSEAAIDTSTTPVGFTADANTDKSADDKATNVLVRQKPDPAPATFVSSVKVHADTDDDVTHVDESSDGEGATDPHVDAAAEDSDSVPNNAAAGNGVRKAEALSYNKGSLLGRKRSVDNAGESGSTPKRQRTTAEGRRQIQLSSEKSQDQGADDTACEDIDFSRGGLAAFFGKSDPLPEWKPTEYQLPPQRYEECERVWEKFKDKLNKKLNVQL